MPILRLLRPERAGTRRRRWTRLIALAGLITTAAIALVAALLAGRTTATATTGSTATATVQRGTVTQTVSAAGAVQAAGTRGLSFSTSGTVTELNVKAGDPVTVGQVLAKIDDSDAQTAVDTAQTAVDTAQTALANAQATASATPTTSCQAATGQQSQPGAGSACAAAGANTGSGTNRGSGGGTDSLMSAQQQLNNAELTLSQARQRLAGTVITAPIAGKVLTATGTVGGTETPGSTPFISLGAATDTEVAASFTETDVASLAVGQTASITLPDRGTQTYTGKVSQVSPTGTTSNQLVRYSVLIAFDQAPTDLLYGQSANVTVTTQTATGVLYVPSTAVTDIQTSTGTVTVRAGGHDQQLTVQIGLRGDRYTEIRSGLSQGQTIVVGAS